MICKTCGKENDDDAKYCNECGARLAAEDSAGASDSLRVGELIYSAYRHSEAGRLEDAILACRGALALDPNNASAHAFLGSLYERRGDRGMAIAEYERAVALNPANDAHRRRLEDLKAGRLSAARPSAIQWADLVQRLKPHAPLIFAGLVVFIVLVAGISLATRGSTKRAPEAARAQERQTQQSSQPQAVYPWQGVPGSPGAAPQGVPQQAPGQQATPQGQEQARRLGVQPGQVQESQGEHVTRPQREGVPSVPLPGAAQLREQRQPVQQSEYKQSKPTSETSPVITPVQEPTSAPVMVTPRAPTPQMTVTESKTTAAPINPGDRAYQLEREEKYREAIAAYTEALHQTTDPAYVLQHRALCHQRLGEYREAIEDYNRAIRSYQEQLRAGRDQNEVARGIRACEAGINVCKEQAR